MNSLYELIKGSRLEWVTYGMNVLYNEEAVNAIKSGQVRSRTWNRPIQISAYNATKQTLYIDWIDYKGCRNKPGPVANGKSWNCNSCETHAFVFSLDPQGVDICFIFWIEDLNPPSDTSRKTVKFEIVDNEGIITIKPTRHVNKPIQGWVECHPNGTLTSTWHDDPSKNSWKVDEEYNTLIATFGGAEHRLYFEEPFTYGQC